MFELNRSLLQTYVNKLMEFYERQDGQLLLRTLPKTGKVKISLHLHCHEVNVYGGSDTDAEIRACCHRVGTKSGKDNLLIYDFLSCMLFHLLSPVFPQIFSVLFAHHPQK